VRERRTAPPLFQSGRRDEAAPKLEEFSKLDPVDTGGNLAGMQAVLFAAAAAKKRQAEEKSKSALEKRDFGRFHHAAYYIASAYALPGEPEQSIYWLEQTADTGFPATRSSSATPISTASASLRASTS
jgi:hypothetical protein